MKKTYYYLLKKMLFLTLLLSTMSVLAQPTITKVAPWRVTNGSTIIVTGAGFAAGTTTVKIGTATIASASLTISSNKIDIAIGSTAVNGKITVTSAGTVVSNETIQYVTPVVKNSTNGITVTRIYTDFNGFWAGPPIAPTSATVPNNSHNLLGFDYYDVAQMKTVTYSTGVNDAILTAKGITFIPQYYRAFSTRGLNGKVPAGAFLLATADEIDDATNSSNVYSANIAGLTCYDVLIDGVNGLDIGTGVTNFNQNTGVDFTSNNPQAGPSNKFLNDNIPDVVFTQIADPGSDDIYFFSDTDGNVVGTPVNINMNGMSTLGTYKLDLFSFNTGDNIDTAVPKGVWGNKETRQIRLAGLDFEDFGIANNSATPDTYINKIHSLSMTAGGTADIAFMAYNTESFKIQAPYIVSAPNPVNICTLPYNNSVTFSVNAGVDGGGTTVLSYQWKKNNVDIIGANSDSYTIPSPIQTTDYATYKVIVENEFGAIIAASAQLRPGGVQTTWNGTAWTPVATPTSSNSLVFTANYNTAVNTELKGCDCTILNNVAVTIPSGATMVLQNALKLSPEIPAGNDPDTGVYYPAIPAGQLVIQNNGSLVQINETANNVGEITYNRTATSLKPYDYVYWSSPVAGFNVAGLSSYTTPMYTWNPTIPNSNSTYGNWEGASGVMVSGKGYIARVSSGPTLPVIFKGVPNNGEIKKTLVGVSMPVNDPNKNYYLLGNPYPSPINAKAFLNTNLDLDGNVRIWTHGTAIGISSSPYYQNFTYNYNPGDYLVYNATASVPPIGFNGYIASGQGFFVKGITTTGTANITFNNTLRYDSTKPAYNNSNFYRMSSDDSEIDTSVIWLGLIGNKNDGAHSNIAVGYAEEATYEKDRMFDALDNSDSPLSLYSLLSSDQKLIIQGRPAPLDINDVVPLGFTAPENNLYKIVIDKVSGIFETDQAIYLEDTYLNIVHDLKAAPYDFTSNIGTFNDRFKLRYIDSLLGVNKPNTPINNTFAYINNNTLHVKTTDYMEGIKVYDLTGKLITKYVVGESNTQELSNSFKYAKGIYLVQIQFKSGLTENKKLISN